MNINPTHPGLIRVNKATQLFPISRSRLYELISERAIRSINFKKRGATRGIRLIDVDSLTEYLNSFAEGPESD